MNKGEKREIIWNIINALLAGSLVFLGSLSSGNITFQSVILSLSASAVIAIMKFRDYWSTQEKDYSHNLFNFT